MDQTDRLKGDIDVTKFQDLTCDTVTLVTVSMLRSYFKRPFTLTQLIKSNYKQFQLKLLKKIRQKSEFFWKFFKSSKKILEHHKKFEKISKNKISLFFRQVRWRCHQACWTLLNRIHFQSLMLMLLVLSLLSLDPPRLVFKLVPRFWLAKIWFDMIRLNSKKVILGIQPNDIESEFSQSESWH